MLATVALPLAPVIANQFRSEIARWYLAEATNRIKSDKPTSTLVSQAQAWAQQDIEDLRDYWIFRAEQTLHDAPQEVAAVLRQAVEHDKSNFFLAHDYAERLAAGSYFEEAAQTLEVGTIPELKDEPLILNGLAYFRALAGIDLDRALEEIERALATNPKSAAMRDTRAWVLFKMGKPLDALEDANFAIEALQAEVPTHWLDQTLHWLDENLAGPPEPSVPGRTLTRREAGEQLWGTGALYYHRAKILEALGRTDQAQADLLWLRQRHLPEDDRIY